MEERKFVNIRKEEFGVKEYIKNEFGKGRISSVKVEYTPVGEKVIIATHKPGLVIGKRGEMIEKLTQILKKKFKMENPHIDIEEITNPDLDSQIIADDIAMTLERFGGMRFKAAAYKSLTRIKKAGALGAEIILSGKLPSDRAKTWRFSYGYLRKTGDESNYVNYAESVAVDKQGMVGIKVSILAPGMVTQEEIAIDEKVLNEIKENVEEMKETEKPKKKSTKKKESKK